MHSNQYCSNFFIINNFRIQQKFYEECSALSFHSNFAPQLRSMKCQATVFTIKMKIFKICTLLQSKAVQASSELHTSATLALKRVTTFSELRFSINRCIRLETTMLFKPSFSGFLIHSKQKRLKHHTQFFSLFFDPNNFQPTSQLYNNPGSRCPEQIQFLVAEREPPSDA